MLHEEVLPHRSFLCNMTKNLLMHLTHNLCAGLPLHFSAKGL